MSWHEKYLSKNNKKQSVSTMGDLFSLIEEVFEVKKGSFSKKLKQSYRF